MEGSWVSTNGTLLRYNGQVKAAATTFDFEISGSTVYLDYQICQKSTSCSGGFDLFGHANGSIKNGQLYLECRNSAGQYVEYLASTVGQNAIDIILPGFGSECAPGKHGLSLQKDSSSAITMTAYDKNYGDVLKGSATITKAND